MALLGHRDLRMTMRYQHLTPEHFRDAMRALGLDRPGDLNWHHYGTGLDWRSGDAGNCTS